MGRRIAMVATLLVALVGVPRTADAGLLDFIWEMSGPQMLGTGYGCFFTTRMNTRECRVGTVALHRLVQTQGIKPDRTFISLGGSIFGSTGKDSKTRGYDLGEVWMVALEPGVVVRSGKIKSAEIFHGAGISYGLLFGRDFKRFDKFAFTVTPIDIAWKHIAVGLKLRLYPHGTTDDEFNSGPRLNPKKFEGTIGATVSYLIR